MIHLVVSGCMTFKLNYKSYNCELNVYLWLTKREIYENSHKILGFLKFDPSNFFPIITSKMLVFFGLNSPPHF